MSRVTRRIVTAVSAVALIVLLGGALLVAVEVTIPLDPWRARVSASLADTLACRVVLDGPLALRTGPRPGIDVATMQVDECPALPGAGATVGGLNVRAQLWPLVRGELRGVEATAERVDVTAPGEIRARAHAPADAQEGPALRLVDVARVQLAAITVTVPRAEGAPMRFAVDSLEASAPAAGPAVTSVKGTFRAEPWQVTLTGPALDALLASPTRGSTDVAADYAGTALGKLSLRSELTWSAQRIELVALEVESAAVALAGSARVEWSGARPFVAADATVSKLDAAEAAKWTGAPGPQRSPAETIEQIVGVLNRIDAELALKVTAVGNAPVAARGIALDARLAGGRLVATGSGVIDDAPGEFRMVADARGPLAVDARATVKRLPRETLGRAQGVAALDPRVGSLTATLSARGPSVERLLRNTETRFAAKDVRLTVPIAGEKIEARLRTVDLDARSEKSLRGKAAGVLGGQPVTLEVSGGSVATLLDGKPWPVTARTRLGDARLDARGEVTAASDGSRARLALDFAAARLDRLKALFPGAPLPAARAALRGTVDIGASAWQVAAESLSLGASRGRGSAGGARKTAQSPLKITLALERLDIDELARGIAAPVSATGSRAQRGSLLDLDFALAAQRVIARGIQLDALTFTGTLRGGRVAPAPLAFGVAGAKVDGTLAADFSGDTPRYGVQATARSLDLARIIGALAEQKIAFRADGLAVKGEARGATTEALLKSAALVAEIEGGELGLPDDMAIAAGARIAFAGRAETRPGTPVAVSAKGTAQDMPFALSGHLAPSLRLLTDADSQPVDLTLDLGDTRFETAGSISAHASGTRYEGHARLAGPSLDTIERLFNAPLPDLPRYAASASVRASDGQLALDDLALQFGESALAGHLAWREAGGRARLEGRLSGKHVRLEDVGLSRLLAADAASATGPTMPGARALELHAERLARFVRAFDADLAVAFDGVTSAGAPVGQAAARLRMDGGRLALEPFSLELAPSGGTARGAFALDARGGAPRYDVHVEAENLEYAAFARALDPKTSVAGTLGLSLHLTSQGAPEELMRRANGTVDVLVAPQGATAKFFDLWTTGLLQTALTRIDPGSESRLNCMVGSFDVTDGVMKSRIVLLDTTRVRVAGELDADFGSRKLTGRLAPRAKRPELFNAEPSFQIGGTLEQPRVLPSAESLVIGALRLYGFPYAFALDWMTSKNLPADGTADCHTAYRGVKR
jgi:uncharacterized protein involved in outer membrane biogenesis